MLAANPRIRILVVTMFEDNATVFTAMRAGARGYVLKDDDKDDVLGAIRTVGRGGAVFGPGVAAPRGLLRYRPSRCPQRSVPRSHRPRA